MESASRQPPVEIDRIVRSIIENAGKPLSAYMIADEAGHLGSPMVPAQVYRRLDRLVQRQCVERIASLKAFVASSRCQFIHFLY